MLADEGDFSTELIRLLIVLLLYILYDSTTHDINYKIKILNDSVQYYYKNKQTNYANDSGLDLVIPEQIFVPANAHGFSINLGISCEPPNKQGYYLYPRSSLSKTPLRLSNSVGIIDAGYRGPIIAKVDNLSTQDYTINTIEDDSPNRLFQLCTPDLKPFKFILVEALSKTERGDRGFGSTNHKQIVIPSK
jgi:dUTP pyrophosphatase